MKSQVQEVYLPQFIFQQLKNSKGRFKICVINYPTYGHHQNFESYSDFLLKRWVINFQRHYAAGEVHFVFDHPPRLGSCP